MGPEENIFKEHLQAQLVSLSEKLAELKEEKSDLEILLETITEHATELENEIHQKNKEMSAYIQLVQKLTLAATAVENNTFDPLSLTEVAIRNDQLGHLSRVFTKMVQSLQAREKELTETNAKLESLFQSASRFVPYEYLRILGKNNITELVLGDHVSETMAVMFSDIRSFTTMAEKMTPKENFTFINAYLQKVSPEIRKHKGFIVKFLGDGIMAVFPGGADDAILAGLAQFEQIRSYNCKRIKEGYSPIQVGIGIHVGKIMVGFVGEENRIEGDALSDNVNLTARLEGLTKFYGISMLISERAYENLVDPSLYQLRFLDKAIVKGRNEPISVYEVLLAEDESARQLKLQTQVDFDQGVEYYCQGHNLDLATDCFMRVLAVNPHDETAKLYLERLKHLQDQGLPDDWHGIWVFTDK